MGFKGNSSKTSVSLSGCACALFARSRSQRSVAWPRQHERGDVHCTMVLKPFGAEARRLFATCVLGSRSFGVVALLVAGPTSVSLGKKGDLPSCSVAEELKRGT